MFYFCSDFNEERENYNFTICVNCCFKMEFFYLLVALDLAVFAIIEEYFINSYMFTFFSILINRDTCMREDSIICISIAGRLRSDRTT